MNFLIFLIFQDEADPITNYTILTYHLIILLMYKWRYDDMKPEEECALIVMLQKLIIS
jgi:hypothetical protein